MFQKVVIIDCKGHLLGRLASVVAKELLNGQKIVCVRCEEMNISGSLIRNKMKFHHFLRKRMNTNPKKGPIHFRAPSKIFWRTVRGMLPHKTPRGAIALKRLTVCEGIPPVYVYKKRVVVPSALRVLKLRPNRPYCRLGDLSTQVGWTYQEVVKTLEEKRKNRGAIYHKKRLALAKVKSNARKDILARPPFAKVQPILSESGF